MFASLNIPPESSAPIEMDFLEAIAVGTEWIEGFSLPVTAALLIWEASRSHNLDLAIPLSDEILRHLTAPQYDKKKGTIARPGDHVDDLFFALFFAVSAAITWDANLC
jgi:hypothetical protein